MSLHPYAGKLAPRSVLANIPELISDYYTKIPDMQNSSQRISFGTS
mgnify:FL=1